MAWSVILNNFRIIDESTGMAGAVFIEDGLISAVSSRFDRQAAVCIDAEALLPGSRLVLMPAFTDLLLIGKLIKPC
jgi:alpha-D-ribose 1-methylphosphonate 5-triphosphate diphosphatase PhnM